MGHSRITPAGRSTRLTWAFSALCGAAAAGLVVAGCVALAQAAHALGGITVPALIVRGVMALVGVPTALLVEAGVHRLVSARGRPAVSVASPPRHEKDQHENGLLLRPGRLPALPRRLSHL